jgi:hypothetical protein
MRSRMDEYQPQNQGDSDSSDDYPAPPSLIQSSSPTPFKADCVKGRALARHIQSDEEDIEVQELEIQLQVAKLKQQHKRLKA